MQNKGIVKFIAVLLILVCCFYLSFSFVVPRLNQQREGVYGHLLAEAVP